MAVTSAVRVSAAVLLLAAAVPLASVAAPDILVFPGGCRDVDAMDSDAWGDAVALIVRVDGEDILDSPYSRASAFQDGPGLGNSSVAYQEVDIPGLLTAKIMYSRVDLRVDRDPLRSQAWSQAEVVDLDILDGTITADVVKAWANGKTEVNLADTTTIDSDIVGLKVGTLTDFDVAPGVTIMVPDDVASATVGPASFVKTYVREDESRFPGNGTVSYVADTTVTMLHVWLSNVPGFGSVEIIVSRAHAHAETPTPFCGLVQSVKGAAYVARVRPDGDESKPGYLVGEQFIGVVGGEARQQLVGVQAPVGPASVMEMNATESEVKGFVKSNGESRSSAMSKVLGLCILQDGTVAEGNTEDYGDCFIGATAIRAESNSKANATAAISWGTVTLVGLTVAGVDVCAELGFPDEDGVEGNGSATTNVCKPPKNSTLELGEVKLFFNQRQYDDPRPGHTGYYVRALRIQGPLIGDIIISRAYSGADYLDNGPGNPIGPLSGEKP